MCTVRVDAATQSALSGRQLEVRSLPNVVIPEGAVEPERCVVA
jgi:hypothetical protein